MMNEENNTAVSGNRPRKKRSFWFLKLLLILIVFAGGIVLGLKLYTMPEPSALLNRYFPTLQSTLNPSAKESEKPSETPPATSPQPTEATTATEEKERPEPAGNSAENAVPEAPEASEANPSESDIGGQDKPTGIQVNETAPEEEATQPIGIDKALTAALNRAGVNETDATVFGVYPTETNGIAAYQVDFEAEGTEFMYLVDMFSGEIAGWKTARVSESYEGKGPADVFNELVPDDLAEQDGLIAETDAENAAFDHAGVKKTSVSELNSVLRRDGAGVWYEVSFKAGNYKYSYFIDAENGMVLDYEREKA